MAISTKILRCNGSCGNCYENTIRKDYDREYNLKAMIKTLRVYLEQEKDKKKDKKKEDQRNVPCIHGGEPLLLSIRDLEKLFKEIRGVYDYTNIQTNGILIKDRHIKLFKKYKTTVGISLDGDTAQLNRGRWNLGGYDEERARKGTDLVIRNIGKLREAGISVSISAVLRKHNADKKNLGEFIRFLMRMQAEFGIRSIRTNAGIVFNEDSDPEELTSEELGYAWRRIFEYTIKDPVRGIQPARDIIDAMFGQDHATCIYGECDPYKTSAEIPIFEGGEIGNCLKTGIAQDGIVALQADHKSDERYRLLENLPQDLGGCKGCEYWQICTAGCPGEAVDNDWRNKTRFCKA